MADLILNPETFIFNGNKDAYYPEGTIEATIGNITKRVNCYVNGDVFTAHGFVGRYRTGKKLWGATVRSCVDPRTNRRWESIDFGFDSRSGRHNKIYDVWFKKD